MNTAGAGKFPKFITLLAMKIFGKLFNKNKVQPEDYYKITVNDKSICVEHPKQPPETVNWEDIHTIKAINTDEGPWLPDIWLLLKGHHGQCLVPHGAKGFDGVYEIVSKYKDFDFESFTKSMACTENTEFMLWKKNG